MVSQADMGDSMTDNTKAIQLLDEWFDEPDEMGVEFWEEYELVPLEIGGMQTTIDPPFVH